MFLFLVGAVLPFSLASIRQKAASTFQIYWRIARRTTLLFILGLLFNSALQFDFEALRIAGVLQRIALCYGLAAIIVTLVEWRGRAVMIALGHSGRLLGALGVCGPAG